MEPPSRDYGRLPALFVNVVRWDTNVQWRKALLDFVPEDIRKEYAEFDPAAYLWSECEKFIVNRLDYDPLEHVVVFVQQGGRHGKRQEVHDLYVWEDILHDISRNRVMVPKNSDINLLITPRKNPKLPNPTMPLRTLDPDRYEREPHQKVPAAHAAAFSVPERLRPSANIADVQGSDVPRPSNVELPSPVASLLRTEAGLGEFEDHSGDVDTTDGDASFNTPYFDSASDYSEAEDGIQGDSTALQVPTNRRKGRASVTTGGNAGPSSSRKVSGLFAPLKAKPSVRGGTARAPSTRGQPNLSPPAPMLTRTPAIKRRGPPPRASGTARPPPIPPKSPLRAAKAQPLPPPPTSTTDTTVVTTTTTLPSPTINTTPPASYLEIVDLLAAEYNVASTSDADYGATNAHVLDTYVGSYNTGNNNDDNKTMWQGCLAFFNLDPVEYNRRQSDQSIASNKTKVRVPMKKLPGMSVGLFDYQLMGVFNLLRFVLADVAGGLLCDEQGLGKTQEMYGLVALAYGLRRCKGEVKAAWRKMASPKKGGDDGKEMKKHLNQHNKPGEVAARSCPFDERYGFRCYCYHALTRELADRLPEGPNVLVAPARSCASMVRDAKAKLDTKVFKIRGVHDGGEKEDKLTSADVSALRATITGTQDNDAAPVYQYQAGAGQSDYIIVVSPEFIPRLNSQFGVEVKVTNSADKAKKSALLPGMVLMDEFHEYATPNNGEDSRTVAWLQHLKKCCLDSQQLTPLAYFVSGTPFGETPADIRSVISLLERDVWGDDASHLLSGATLESFDGLVSTFDRLTGAQARGEAVSLPEIADYRRRLDRVLKHMMVRRLGTDEFQGRKLTDIGPLKVSITDHLLPFSSTASLQSLADRTRELAMAAAKAQDVPLRRLLRSKTGEALLLKLRLASTFPGIAASPSADNFTFTSSEIHAHLTQAKGDVTKTPYHQHMPVWCAASPKLETISQTITTMLADKTPIPGAPSHTKKYCIFSPLEAESLLLYLYLLHKRTHPKTKGSSSSLLNMKPVLLHSAMPQSQRQQILDSFLTEGHAPPNVLVAPLALAGTGLNLQRAKYSTVTSPAWTKRENQQAYYRLHRVGQRQETQLQLLTGRWNPAERVVLGGYEGGLEIGEDSEEGGEGVWEVGNRFCEKEGEEGLGGGLVERHQGVVEGK
ncbi:hypothetical protein C8A00DRAFT_16287 [Chaetomidium leptoderma]|uniref:Helicase C-terminal domain-containing protein n=1 Tax=Chaetomidium leptoderma TaxID=669021 RepID=A0AAN6VJF7_9PEZI|nr:hypothetical protein C8A00DRAFT_16287 [Chaetomidium leptoderma]